MNKFARRQGRDAGYHEQVSGGELRGQENLERNTDLIEMNGDQAREESGSTGPGRWRDTPRISRS